MSSDRHTVQEASEPERVIRKFRGSKDCSKALKLIKPAPNVAHQCESAIERAVRWVRYAKALDKFPSAAELKNRFRTYAKALRAVEIAGRGLAPYKGMSEPDPSFMDQVRCQREEYEELANEIPVRSGCPQRKTAKQVATHFAYELLAQYGSHGAPGLTQEGSWHQLATILFEHADADLFDYLRNYHLWRASLRLAMERDSALLANPNGGFPPYGSLVTWPINDTNNLAIVRYALWYDPKLARARSTAC